MIKKLYIFLFVYDLNDSPVNVPAYADEHWKTKLRRDITFLVLIFYTLFIFNPLMPILADMTAHIFWEKEHIESMHKQHGNDHLHIELANAEKHPDKDKSTGNSKTGQEEYLYVNAYLVFAFSNYHFIKQSYPCPKFYCPVSYPDIDYPPPRA